MPTGIFIILICVYAIPASSLKYHKKYSNDSGMCSKPLILTPFIESGEIKNAQELASVHLAYEMISYSGYLTVNKSCNSNLFFWYIPSQSGKEKAPLTLWLQGGPGTSSMYGMFEEIGPFKVTNENQVVKRNFSWNAVSSLLFIDQPVGTGYSFAEKEECLVMSEDDIRKDLYTALLQFLNLFPELQKNDFYIFGESYAGKFIPALAYSIHENNLEAELKINLKGLGMGNSFSDPISMMVYCNYVYQLGIVDETGKKEIQDLERKAVEFIENQVWMRACEWGGKILNLINSYLVGIYDYRKTITRFSGPVVKYITNNVTRCAIHVGKRPYNLHSSKVQKQLAVDCMKSVKSWIDILVENYPILFYHGQFDVTDYPLTRNFINTMIWSGADEFKKSNRSHFLDESGKVCGYIKRYKNLNLALIRNAGHMIPKDKPKCAYQLYKMFISYQDVVPEISGGIN